MTELPHERYEKSLDFCGVVGCNLTCGEIASFKDDFVFGPFVEIDGQPVCPGSRSHLSISLNRTYDCPEEPNGSRYSVERMGTSQGGVGDALRMTNGMGTATDADWASVLKRHARAMRRAVPASSLALKRQDRDLLQATLGDATDDVVAIVESFVIGFGSFGARRQHNAAAAFERQLDLVLDALSQTAAAREVAAQSGGGAEPNMIQSDLWQVLHCIRESADLSYSREIDLNELDRRILFLLQSRGPLPPAEISSAMGVDKAQVSRSVKRLIELGIGERAQLRSPLGLTGTGQEIAKRLARLAELRNRELIFDVSDPELTKFFSIVEILLDRAVALYEIEREQAQGPVRIGKGAPMLAHAEERRPADRIAIDRSRIISPLLTLSAYFSRSGALAYRRLAGLSAFEAFVMSEIGRNPPIEWGDLVVALQRDHSQAGRTVNALMDRGLVERDGRPGRRNGRFSHTEEGETLYRIICETALERSAFLLEPLAEEQRIIFLATFDKIRRNAAAQLERERALAELPGGEEKAR